MEEGVAYAQQVMPVQLRALARQVGAEQVEVQTVRADRTAPVVGECKQRIYLGTELTFMPVGHPAWCRKHNDLVRRGGLDSAIQTERGGAFYFGFFHGRSHP